MIVWEKAVTLLHDGYRETDLQVFSVLNAHRPGRESRDVRDVYMI